MKRVGLSLWKGLWLIFVQSDIKTCSSLPSPCLQSDPQINTSDLVKFEASYKFYLSWQKKQEVYFLCSFYTVHEVMASGWCAGISTGSGAHMTTQRNYCGDKWHCQWLPWQNSVQRDENNVQEHKKCEKVTLGQHGKIQRVQPNTENFLKPALTFLYLSGFS